MKYVWLNIKSFLKKEPVIFSLVLLCITASVTVIYFSFGLYHHLEQKKMDEQYGTDELLMEFLDESRSEVTKGDVVELCKGMPEEILENCTWELEAKIPGEERFEDSIVDHTASITSLIFQIRNGELTAAPLEKKWKENGVLVDGNYFTAEQVENGELVCIANPEDEDYADGEQAEFAKRYETNGNGKFEIGGKEYECIGHAHLLGIVPMVPVTTVEDDAFVQSMAVTFDHMMTREEYQIITGVFREFYGDMIQISDFSVPDMDSTKFYDTLTLLCVMMAALSGIVLAMLYQYILLQRKEQLTIYRMCGLTIGRARNMYFFECLLLSMASYLIALLVYLSGMLPFLKQIFEYMGKSYNFKSCGLLGLLYIGIISIVMRLMLYVNLDRNIVKGYHE